MPETAVVLAGDALGQIAVLAFFFLFALYFVIKRAVAAAIRDERSSSAASSANPSVDHYGE